MRSVYGLVAALVVSGPGCRSHQLARDQDHIRAAVLDLQTNQVLDNLVRLRKGLPVIQLDYTNMTGTITQTGTGTVNGGQTEVRNRPFAAPASGALARIVTNVVNASGTATQVNQLTITAQPVLNAPEVYNAYLTYLKVDDRLRETFEPPPCGAAIAVRWYYADCCEGGCDACAGHHRWWKKDRSKVYYWVPVEYRDDFRRLSLYAVAVRGQPVAVSPNFEVGVLGLVSEKKVGEDVFELYLKIDQKIPNDRGHMIATINGRLFEGKDDLKILINTTGGLRRAQPGEILSPDQQTDVIVLSVNVNTLGVGKDDLVKALAGKKVGIRLENFAPSGSPTERLLNDIRTQLELFRLNQFQPTPR